jgi:hypothetical protein
LMMAPLILGISGSLWGEFLTWSEGKPTPSGRLAYSIYQSIWDFRSIHIRDDNHIIDNTNAKIQI